MPIPENALQQTQGNLGIGEWNGQVTATGPVVNDTNNDTTSPQEICFERGSNSSPSDSYVGYYTASPTSSGQVVLTPQVPGLKSVPFTVNIVSTGMATQLGLASQPSQTSFSADTVGKGSTFDSYSLQAEDAGNYTVKVTDTATGATVSGLTENFTMTAGQPAMLAVTPSSSSTGATVSTTNPSTTLSAQLEDAWGNPIHEGSGVVDFTGGGTNAPTLSASEVATNSNGVATVTATEPKTAGDSGNASAEINSAWATKNNDTATLSSVDSGTILVASSTATKVSAYRDNTRAVWTAGGLLRQPRFLPQPW